MNNADAASAWTQTSEEDFNDNGTLTNLTIVGTGESAELKVYFSEITHWTEKQPTFSTTLWSRNQHEMAPIYGTNKILLFGGDTFRSRLKDTWVYDVDNNTWTNLILNPAPPGRNRYGMASIWGEDKVVIFGGGDYEQPYFNDTWIYDLSNNTWTKKITSITPQKRFKHAMTTVYNDDKVILYGGRIRSTSFAFTDIWLYDLDGNTWTKKTQAPNPGVKSSHAMATFYGTDKMLLFGGEDFSGMDSDETWLYNLSNNTWTKLNPPTKPGPRVDHSMATIQGTDKILLFGGIYDVAPYHTVKNDTWIYDLSDNTWTELCYNPCPNHRYGHRLASVYGSDKVLLFGGREYMPSISKNDTWVYKHQLMPKNGTYVSSPYYTNYNSSFKTISWNDLTPKNSSIEFQLRTANNESNLYSKPFVGPDGTIFTFYTTPHSRLWSGHDGDRWVQYKAYFVMNNFTDSLILKDVTITYNCLPEVVAIGPKNGSLLPNNKPTFTWTFLDVDSEEQRAFQLLIDDDTNFEKVMFDSGKQNTSSQNWEFPIGTNYTKLPDGTYYWKVRTQDQDDDWTKFSEPRKMIIDTHAPGSTTTWPVNNAYYNSVTEIYGFAEDTGNTSPVTQVEITIKNFKNNSYWNGLAWTHLPVWLLTEGSTEWWYDTSSVFWETKTIYVIRSRATDGALNVEHPDFENLFNIDRDGPWSSILTPIHGAWANELNNITGTSEDIGGSGIKAVELSIKCVKDFNSWDGGSEENYYWNGSGWNTNEYWLTASSTSGTTDWFYDSSKIKWFTGDKYLIQSRAIDKVDNKETPGIGISFYYDDTPPNELSIYINLGETYTTNTNVILSLQAEDYGLGVSQMSFSTDNNTWTPWETFNVTKIFDLPEGDGEIRIYFRVRDQVNNVAAPVFDTIILDSTPPEKLFVIINENAEFTNSDYVTLTLAAKDPVSGLKDMTFSNDADTWLPWEPYKISKVFYLIPGDGVKKIFFRIKDNAGNIANPVFDSIILDKTKPHSLSVLINYGALETNSTKTTLSLSALDDLSDVEQMSVSIDGSNWTAWEPFKNEMSITLPPLDGEKTIYFRVKDKAGNVAEPVVDNILLNTTEIQAQEIQKEKASENLLHWYVIVILIFCILGIIILWLFMFKQEKQRIERKLLLPSAEIVTPEILPGPAVISTQIKAPPTPEQLPASPTIPTPILAKSTQIETITTPTQPEQATTTQVPQLPQLPPAKEQNAVHTDTITSTPQVALQPKEPKNGD